jgi:predicted amidohydrolase YtcJ
MTAPARHGLCRARRALRRCGRRREARALIGPSTRTLDLAGKTVVPGFCDAHLHLLSYGTQLLRQADLVGSESVDDVLARLSAHAQRSRR